VSGHRIIKMEDLKRMFEMPGIKNITSYIQSGNILFDAIETDTDKLVKKIEKQLFKSLNYEVEVFVRSITDMAAIIKNNPFKNESLSKELKLYVSFLPNEPAKEQVKKLESLSYELEKYKLTGREVYALIRKDSTEKLKHSNMFIEKKLGMLATTRDWNTINKIIVL
jgi:uncharacterized protein (DUF1697 family)